MILEGQEGEESQHQSLLSPGQSWLKAERQGGEITLDDGPAVRLLLQQSPQSLQAGVITSYQDLQQRWLRGEELSATGSGQHVVI